MSTTFTHPHKYAFWTLKLALSQNPENRFCCCSPDTLSKHLRAQPYEVLLTCLADSLRSDREMEGGRVGEGKEEVREGNRERWDGCHDSWCSKLYSILQCMRIKRNVLLSFSLCMLARCFGVVST